jgi:MOSC domain-containing protein YiiM
MKVAHLFISPGHNFFGHHGHPAGQEPVLAMKEIECVAGRGIRGDRFFDYRPDYKGQITFFSCEIFTQLKCELHLPNAKPTSTRRNVFLSGTNLNTLIGVSFELQGIQFVGVEESKPCHWMNQALGPGAEDWLRGRAGLRCRILTTGMLHLE